VDGRQKGFEKKFFFYLFIHILESLNRNRYNNGM
jgi:hypothetical protein